MSSKKKARGCPADRQVRNASRPRPGRGPNENYPQQMRNTCNVKPDPVDKDAFTLELFDANQCVGYEFLPVEDTGLRTLITRLVADEMRTAKNLTDNDGTSVLFGKSEKLNAVVDAVDETDSLEDVLILRKIAIGQLLKKSKPDLSNREDGKDDKDYMPEHDFETYTVLESKTGGGTTEKLYCQAPTELGGWHAEVVLAHWQKSHHIYEFEVLHKEEYIGVRIYCKMRPKDHMYNDSDKKEQCVKVEVGEFDVDDKYKPGDAISDTIFIKNTNDDLFAPGKWHKLMNDTGIESDQGGDEDTEDNATTNFMFENHNDTFCTVRVEEDGRKAYGSLCNFEITGVPHLYTFDDAEMEPLYEIICKIKYSDEGEEIVVGPDDVVRSPDRDGCSTLTVHALININACHTKRDVREQFQKQCNYLLTTGLTSDMLVEYIAQQWHPKDLHMIDKWGLQDDGWWVLSNCAFKDGELKPVSESGHSVYHRYFTHNAFVPMPVTNFPKILICEVPHVRYFIGCLMWNRLMPPYFGNNEQPAKAVFCSAMLGMHAHEFWNMVGSLKGAPTVWAVSREPGSGKSESFKLAQEIVGVGHRALWGGDATKAATFDASVADSGIIRFIDDVVVPSNGRNGPESVMYQEIVRGFFDRTGRQVCGKPERAPNCTLGYSSNSVINMKDHPFQSRLLTLEYKPLSVDDVEWNGFTESDFFSCRALMSCLMPDLEMIGKFNGKIDTEAITDLVTWLESVQKVKRYRPCANSAKLAFIELNTIDCFGGGPMEKKAFLKWFVNDVTRTVCELNQHPGIIDQFLLSLIEVRDQVSPNVLGLNPERIIYWHNFRTEIGPVGYLEMPNGQANHRGYWTIRVGQVATVIKNVLGRSFDEKEIYNAVKNSSSNIKEGQRGAFYDVMRGWPLKKTIIPQNSDVTTDVPLEESELLSDTLIKTRCIYVKMEHIESLYKSINSAESIDDEYTQIVIKSCVPGIADYNFYELAVSGQWFGYRTLEQCSFARFCGAKNKIYCGASIYDPVLVSKEIELEHRALGLPPVLDCFKPQYIEKLLHYNGCDIESYPPCWMKMPFMADKHADDVRPCDPFDQCKRSTSDYDYYDPTETELPNKKRAHEYYEEAPDTAYKPAKTSRRASPSNQARYPRPPAEIKTLADAVAMGRYVRAGGPLEDSDVELGPEGGGDDIPSDFDDWADAMPDDTLDEEQNTVRVSVH